MHTQLEYIKNRVVYHQSCLKHSLQNTKNNGSTRKSVRIKLTNRKNVYFQVHVVCNGFVGSGRVQCDVDAFHNQVKQVLVNGLQLSKKSQRKGEYETKIYC